MTRTFSIMTIVLLVALAAGCTNTTAVSNANTAAETATTKPGPDNSEITSSANVNGMETETRVFRDNPRIAKVVITTQNGTRTVKAYSTSGEERDLNRNEPENVLEATGNTIADAAGFVAHKSEDLAGDAKDLTKEVGEKTVDTAKTVKDKTVEGAKTVGEKTADGAKTVGEKTADGAKTVSEKTVEGAQTVGSKTAAGAKKAGRTIKKIIP